MISHFVPAEIIKKKRSGAPLSADEIQFFIQSYTENKIPDYQMSALLMAIYFRGMTHEETLTLTKCMLESGQQAKFPPHSGFKVDKHSTGGVGDKTTLLLGPIVAACGVKVPSISGRGLGHTGGTLDKLESVPGFKIQKTLAQFVEQTLRSDICFIGQTPEICPADRKMYALRDVTATVESLPLICASILSKKLAEGIDGLVLDVKFGSGAFMKTEKEAHRLAELLMSVAKLYGKKVTAFLTSMEQPLGRFAGNALEVKECLDLMSGKNDPSTEDTKELSLQLAAAMLHVANYRPHFEACYEAAQEKLSNGSALKKFEELCALQGGDLSQLHFAQKTHPVLSENAGWVSSFDTEGLGYVGIMLKAGRLKSDDRIDHSSGIEFHKKIGDRIEKGEKIFTLHCDDASLLPLAIERIKKSYTSSLQKPPPHVLIKTILQ